MRATVLAYGGIKKSLKCLFLLIVIFFVATPVLAADVKEYTPYFNIETNSDFGQDVSHYNVTTQLQNKIAPNTTPWEIWIGSGILGLVLFLYSLRPVKSMDELESSIIVAVLACVSTAFCAYSSFGIDRITGYGVTSQIFNTSTKASATFYNHEYVYMENHLIYSQPVIAILMTVLFFVIIGFTMYRVSSHRGLTQIPGDDE